MTVPPARPPLRMMEREFSAGQVQRFHGLQQRYGVGPTTAFAQWRDALVACGATVR